MERPSALFVVRRERFPVQGCPLLGDLSNGMQDLRRKMGNQVDELLADAGANVLPQDSAHEIGQFIVRVLWKEHLALSGAEPGLVDIELQTNGSNHNGGWFNSTIFNICNYRPAHSEKFAKFFLRNLLSKQRFPKDFDAIPNHLNHLLCLMILCLFVSVNTKVEKFLKKCIDKHRYMCYLVLTETNMEPKMFR